MVNYVRKVDKMLKFLLLVNKQGHTRVSQYYEHLDLEERTTMEAEITRKCLARSDDQVQSTCTVSLEEIGIFQENAFVYSRYFIA